MARTDNVRDFDRRHTLPHLVDYRSQPVVRALFTLRIDKVEATSTNSVYLHRFLAGGAERHITAAIMLLFAPRYTPDGKIFCFVRATATLGPIAGE